ncbi:MAG TPA: acyl-CoA thioesterase [Chthoniobacterales bacterium]
MTVPPQAIDVNGHANNVAYVQWMQDAAIAHAEALGIAQAANAIGATWVARSHRIEYLRPAFLDEQLVVATWLMDLQKVGTTRKCLFVRKSDAAVIARGETHWILVDIERGRPKSIPKEPPFSTAPVAFGHAPTVAEILHWIGTSA